MSNTDLGITRAQNLCVKKDAQVDYALTAIDESGVVEWREVTSGGGGGVAENVYEWSTLLVVPDSDAVFDVAPDGVNVFSTITTAIARAGEIVGVPDPNNIPSDFVTTDRIVILIRPGVYTENITLPYFVTLKGTNCDGFNADVARTNTLSCTLNGTITMQNGFSPAVSEWFTIQGIELTAASNVFNFSGGVRLCVENCIINAGNDILVTSGPVQNQMDFFNCEVTFEVTSIPIQRQIMNFMECTVSVVFLTNDFYDYKFTFIRSFMKSINNVRVVTPPVFNYCVIGSGFWADYVIARNCSFGEYSGLIMTQCSGEFYNCSFKSSAALFNETNVKMYNCTITSNPSSTPLYLKFGPESYIDNCTFFDIDVSVVSSFLLAGTYTNCLFRNIGNSLTMVNTKFLYNCKFIDVNLRGVNNGNFYTNVKNCLFRRSIFIPSGLSPNVYDTITNCFFDQSDIRLSGINQITNCVFYDSSFLFLNYVSLMKNCVFYSNNIITLNGVACDGCYFIDTLNRFLIDAGLDRENTFKNSFFYNINFYGGSPANPIGPNLYKIVYDNCVCYSPGLSLNHMKWESYDLTFKNCYFVAERFIIKSIGNVNLTMENTVMNLNFIDYTFDTYEENIKNSFITSGGVSIINSPLATNPTTISSTVINSFYSINGRLATIAGDIESVNMTYVDSVCPINWLVDSFIDPTLSSLDSLTLVCVNSTFPGIIYDENLRVPLSSLSVNIQNSKIISSGIQLRVAVGDVRIVNCVCDAIIFLTNENQFVSDCVLNNSVDFQSQSATSTIQVQRNYFKQLLTVTLDQIDGSNSALSENTFNSACLIDHFTATANSLKMHKNNFLSGLTITSSTAKAPFNTMVISRNYIKNGIVLQSGGEGIVTDAKFLNNSIYMDADTDSWIITDPSANTTISSSENVIRGAIADAGTYTIDTANYIPPE